MALSRAAFFLDAGLSPTADRFDEGSCVDHAFARGLSEMVGVPREHGA